MITPHGKHIIVKRHPPEVPVGYQTPSLIYLPETVLARARSASVISIGSEVEHPSIKPQSIVLIAWYGGHMYDDKDLGEIEVFHEDQIMAVVEA